MFKFNPNPKTFEIQSQSQSFKNSMQIPIPKFEPNPKQYQKYLYEKTSEILKKSIPSRNSERSIPISWDWDPSADLWNNYLTIFLIIKVVKRKNNDL